MRVFANLIILFACSCAPLAPTSPLGAMNTNGLLILSKLKFTTRRTVDFYPNIIELFVRGFLEAKVNITYLYLFD
ncbi:hypothetical protein DPMN_010651 [Dreissena polymorpha]|uniref:Secreted protein n=1 Tax=Dreissena polymorpha TaxID=45954 RepID=A0A9D4N3J5_DREPO|nr:hypothetical protein DPMN_010651 [Dreissena polymorpha]